MKAGKLLQDEPVDAPIFWAYGYDSQGRIIYSAYFAREELPYFVTFYEYKDYIIEAIHYSRPDFYSKGNYRLECGARLTLNDSDNAIHYIEVNSKQYALWEAYHYAEMERIQQIFVVVENNYGQAPYKHYWQEDYVYEGQKLQKILRQNFDANKKPFGELICMYEAAHKGESAQALFEKARQSLLVAVWTLLEKAPIMEKLFCVCLSYDAVADNGISLALTTEQSWQIWQPLSQREIAEFYYENVLITPSQHLIPEQSPEAYQRFLLRYRYNEQWGKIRKLLNQVCLDLNQMNWDGILNVANDFFFFAHDYEVFEDIKKDIRACVPKEKLKRLREKGYL